MKKHPNIKYEQWLGIEGLRRNWLGNVRNDLLAGLTVELSYLRGLFMGRHTQPLLRAAQMPTLFLR
jgi:hypothetical protein